VRGGRVARTWAGDSETFVWVRGLTGHPERAGHLALGCQFGHAQDAAAAAGSRCDAMHVISFRFRGVATLGGIAFIVIALLRLLNQSLRSLCE